MRNLLLKRLRSYKHKKTMIVVGIIVIVVAVYFCTFLLPQHHKTSAQKEYEKVLQSEPEQLPRLLNIDTHTTPFLWDFVNGSIGWHTPINLNAYDSTVVVMVHKKDFNTVFVSKYKLLPSYSYPSIGTMPYAYTVGNPNAFKEATKHMSKARIIQENDNTFYVITNDINAANLSNSTIKDYAHDNEFGSILLNDIPANRSFQQYAFDIGQGFDYVWINRPQYKENLTYLGIDYANPYYKLHPYLSFTIYKDGSGEQIKVYCNPKGAALQCEFNNALGNQVMTEKLFQYYIKSQGFVKQS